MRILGIYFVRGKALYSIWYRKLSLEFVRVNYWCKSNKPFIRIYWEWKLLNE